MNIWTLTTCIPDEPNPVIPQVFLSAEAAETAFKDAMRGEWEGNGPCWDGDGPDQGETQPFPEHLPAQEIHDLIVAAQPGDGEQWGRYVLMHHQQEG